jgi:hypothetical protein
MVDSSESDDSAPAPSSSGEDQDEEEAEEDEEEDEACDEEAKVASCRVAEDKNWWMLHPARKLLLEEFKSGNIPLDYNRKDTEYHWMKPRDIYNIYKDSDAFEGLEYEGFAIRLNSLRKIVEKKNKRVTDDMNAFQIFRKNFPPQPHNHRGELRWEGSEAQALLKEDIEVGTHLEFGRPKLFWLSRPEYQLFNQSIFRGHIDQEKRLRKQKTLLKRKKGEEADSDDD